MTDKKNKPEEQQVREPEVELNRRQFLKLGGMTVVGIGTAGLFGGAIANTGPVGAQTWEITLAGKVVAKGELDKDETITIPLKKGEAVVEIKDGQVDIVPMPTDICPKGICAQMGPIPRNGNVIICMPNKLLISVR